MINRKFINFKTYNGFLAKKNEIPNDAIVFIQDKLCIWAQGKEYICDGPGTTAIVDNTLTFTNGNDKAVFTVTQDGGTLEFKDSEGNKSSATYILRDEFDSKANQADLDILNEWKTKFEKYVTNIIESQVDRSELADVAFSGQYQDLKGKPDIPVVDSVLSSTSTNPVWNKTITLALEGKANASDLDNYVTDHDLTKALSSKQDILRAGRGISIDGKVISSTLDTEVYVMVDELGDPEDADPNKIYILEKKVGDTYRYQQYRVRNNTWVLIGEMSPDVDLSGYLTKTVADTIYQPIGSYLTSVDLIPYALAEDLSRLNEDLADYALKQYVDDTFQQKGEYAYKDYVDNTFVKRSEVYNPKQDNWGTDSTSGGGGSEPIIINQGSNITVDSSLSLTSANPVQNAVITAELNKKATKSLLSEYATLAQLDAKADKTQLNSYVTNDDLLIALESKQDHLTAGDGISIVNNVISTNLDIDTSVYLFVDELPLTNINDDKIYIVGDEDDGQIVYTLWKHQDGEWIPIGNLLAEIDLTDYITREDAAATFAPKLSYVTTAVLEAFRLDLESFFLKKGDYITMQYADDTYQPKNNYLTSVDLVPYAKITDLDLFLTELDLLTVLGDYATKLDLQDLSDFVALTYLKLVSIYTEVNNGNGQDTPSDPSNPVNPGNVDPTTTLTIINNITYEVEVDSALSATSKNPVQNKIVKAALDSKAELSMLDNYALKNDLNSKADKSQLSDYVTSTDLTTLLGTKQDILSAGTGIAISNNVVSCTVDTTLYIVVDELPPANTADPNKIYILETYSANGTFRYQQYRLRKGTWASFDAAMPTIDLSGYLTRSDAASTYQAIGSYLTAADLVGYARLEDLASVNVDLTGYLTQQYADTHYMTIGDYALTSYVDSNFVRKTDVYNPASGTWDSNGTSSNPNSIGTFPITLGGSSGSGSGTGTGEGGQTIIINNGTDIDIDEELDETSHNPVANSVITLALRGKADLTDLNQYATLSQVNAKLDASVIENYTTTVDLEAALDNKQDCLSAGDGISIIDNVISSTIDTNMWVIVDELPATNISSNKIYLVETEDNGETIYVEYRYRDGEWVEIGQKTPEVDLSDYQRKGNYIEVADADNRYLTEQKIAGRYQEAGDYVESDYADEHYQLKGNYVNKDVFDAFRAGLGNMFQRAGSYVLASDVSAALITLQSIIDQKYVLKTDVPMGNDYSTTDPVQITIATSGNDNQQGAAVTNMVTLTVSQYETLVENNMVQENTYYFTYEEEEQGTTWGFGGQFPIILT